MNCRLGVILRPSPDMAWEERTINPLNSISLSIDCTIVNEDTSVSVILATINIHVGGIVQTKMVLGKNLFAQFAFRFFGSQKNTFEHEEQQR